jgi:radical SAM superfamily enzyme YgiQ (UPF0313 family)
MNIPVVAFIGFEEFENLGVGYMSAVLNDAGYDTTLIDIRKSKKEILNILHDLKPLVVGFSVIFQYHINEFADLVSYLRKGGVSCHFSAGGQFASLRYGELFKIIPSLDSIVRFDGEYTFLELVNCLTAGTGWNHVLSIVYKTENGLKANGLRVPEKNLDNFPFPIRSPLKNYVFGKKFTTILAGRGCNNNCIFCSVREYYTQSNGPCKRTREPAKVAGEMQMLHEEKDCSVYLFQDDDFPAKATSKTDWVRRFCRELKQRNLSESVMWKINCRPDEVDFERFALMKKHGLYLVFLGIEDGTDDGLRLMNKHCTVTEIMNAVDTLKKLEIGFDYGFLPFHPYSTFASVRENFAFLRNITRDGYSGVTFIKMMPYHATPVEAILRKEERLKTINGFPDYDFLDESLNQYYQMINKLFSKWIEHPDGLLNILRWVRNYFLVFSRFYEMTPAVEQLNLRFREIVAESNDFILSIVDQLSIEFETGKFEPASIRSLKMRIGITQNKFINMFKNIATNLMIIGEFQRMTGICLDYHN